MSFFGKQFKKIDADNIIEFLDANNVNETVRTHLRKTNAVSTFIRNDDGTIQYRVSDNDTVLLDQRIVLDEEANFTTPDGTVTRNLYTLNGDVLKSVMTFPDGSTTTFVRRFDGDNMTLTLTSSKTDLTATIKYTTV